MQLYPINFHLFLSTTESPHKGCKVEELDDVALSDLNYRDETHPHLFGDQLIQLHHPLEFFLATATEVEFHELFYPH